MAADANLGLELIGSNGCYLLLDYLGGGQTAGVYRARAIRSQRPERLNQVVAVKLMASDLEPDTRKRFLQEVDILTELQNAERDFRWSTGQGEDDISAVPTVWDEQRSGPAPFFVMTLAQGEPLDEILRRQRQFPEAQALDIARQMAAVLALLHERLNRSYLDFQPRNLFWQAGTAHLTVIDWNLLSPKNQPDIADDLSRLAGLLYRMLSGATFDSQGKAGIASGKEWEEISRGTRTILRRALDPRPTFRYTNANELREALQRQYDLWQRYGDDLLVDAGAMERQSSQATDVNMARSLLDEAWVLFDMALRRGTSPNPVIQKVREGLQQRLESQARAKSQLQTGKMLLDGRDYAKALELFAEALAEAYLPRQRLAARRWLLLGEAARSDYIGYGTVREKLGAALQACEENAWGDNDWPEIHLQLNEVTAWEGAATVCAEIEAYVNLRAGLAGLANLEAVQAASASLEGRAHLKHKTAEVRTSLAKLRVGLETLDALPADEGQSYRSDAWTYLGDGDEIHGREWVVQAVATLTNADDRLTQLGDGLETAKSPESWRALLANFGTEPLVLRGCLDACWDWLGRSNDVESRQMALDILAKGVVDEPLRAEAERISRLVSAFRRSENLLAALTALYRTQAAAQGRTDPGEASAVPPTQAAAAGGEIAAAVAKSTTLPQEAAEVLPVQPDQDSELPESSGRESGGLGQADVAVTDVEPRAKAAAAVESVAIEPIRLADEGRMHLAVAVALREIFELIPVGSSVPDRLRQRAFNQVEMLADLAAGTGQGVLSTGVLIDGLEQAGAVAADAAQAWCWRLAQAQKDQDLSVTARKEYVAITEARQAWESEKAKGRAELDNELMTKRSEKDRLAAEIAETKRDAQKFAEKRRRWDVDERARLKKEHDELAQRLGAEQSSLREQIERAKTELAEANQRLEVARSECEAERQRLLEAARAEAKGEHDTTLQKLDSTLAERRQQLADIEESYAQREQKETQRLQTHLEALRKELGERTARNRQLKEETSDLNRQLDELRKAGVQPDSFISNVRIPIAAQALESVAQAARMALSDDEASLRAAADLLDVAQEQAQKSGNNQVVEVVKEWKHWLELIPHAMKIQHGTWPPSDEDRADAWKLISQAWEALRCQDEVNLVKSERLMIDAAKWAGEPVGNREAYEMLGSITSWQREVAERRRTPSGLLKSAEYQELIDRAIRLFIEGGTINDCTNVMKDIQSLKRSAGPRSQHVNSLLTSCNDLLETWRKNANSLLAEWNGQIKNSPVGGIQARITNLMSAGVKGDKKPGDILTATAKAVQDRFDTEYKDYERAQNPTYRNTSRSAGIIREEMKKLVTLQGTLVEMSQEITQGGDAGIAEQLDRMNKICNNLDKQ